MLRLSALLARIAPVLVGAVRVALGALWLLEGITKYRAGFGAADILLVADSSSDNPRVPDFYAAFTSGVLAPLAPVFGIRIPLLETCLGAALILGALTRFAAAASIATLAMYWLADQLIAQYPIMLVLSAVLLCAPHAASRYSVARVFGSSAPPLFRARGH